MGLFSSGPKISKRDFKQSVEGMGYLEPSDRDRLTGAFDKYSSGGITRGEARNVIRTLLRDKRDNLSKSEIRAVRRELRKKFK